MREKKQKQKLNELWKFKIETNKLCFCYLLIVIIFIVIYSTIIKISAELKRIRFAHFNYRNIYCSII